MSESELVTSVMSVMIVMSVMTVMRVMSVMSVMSAMCVMKEMSVMCAMTVTSVMSVMTVTSVMSVMTVVLCDGCDEWEACDIRHQPVTFWNSVWTYLLTNQLLSTEKTKLSLIGRLGKGIVLDYEIAHELLI